jgi:hypothetical protein
VFSQNSLSVRDHGIAANDFHFQNRRGRRESSSLAAHSQGMRVYVICCTDRKVPTCGRNSLCDKSVCAATAATRRGTDKNYWIPYLYIQHCRWRWEGGTASRARGFECRDDYRQSKLVGEKRGAKLAEGAVYFVNALSHRLAFAALPLRIWRS